MSRHEDSVRLRHILAHAAEAADLVQGKTREDVKRTRVLELALVRLVEIVGEAASRVSQKVRRNHPQIPWVDIVGMRNRIVHGYDRVDLDVLWDTVIDDFPPLIAELEKILPPESAG
jgi:uncharacterized protein with HEPN domain